ncbi:hypothetical protein TrVE_jg11224 [Triparma verrucosa]|uniref:FHA domain-containing protein n=1 Tax=Triparma verrucosa TaxID=1606542 RepID=A0A9W7C8G1_9STRA|nr:hypothetical protein TrVE_jg11224 [Triparma verrucosa]
MSSAPVPSWKVSPPTGWVIEAMKGGVSRGLLSLGRGIEGVECFEVMANNEDTFIVGRGEDCDIEISNPLASRVHATIAFRTLPNASNITLPYIYDCASSHGVYLNMKSSNRLPPKKWSELYSGDILQFGEHGSTEKIYLLRHVAGEKSGEELDRTKVWTAGGEKGRAVISGEINYVPPAPPPSSSSSPPPSPPSSDASPLEIDDLTKFPTEDLPRSVQKFHTRYLTKSHKLSNLLLEVTRIEAKRDTSESGLSEGQENTILKNNEKIRNLQEDMEGLEKEIMTAMGRKVKKEGKKQPVSKEGGFYEEEEDIYDRTATTKVEEYDVKTSEGMLKRRYQVLKVVKKLEIEVEEKGRMSRGLVKKMDKAKEEDDEVEVYVVSEQIKEVEGELVRLEGERMKNEKEIKQLEEDLDLIKGGWRDFEYDEGGKKIVEKVPAWLEVANKQNPTSAKKNNQNVQKIERKKDDDKEITWRPPENQDGSGKTKLNEKFAGRY